MAIPNASLIVLLLTCLLAVSAVAQCPKNGIYNGFQKACCPKICGQCGGKGCYAKSLQLKTRCCANGVRKFSPSCANSGPPCKLNGASSPTPPKNNPSSGGSSSLNGYWRTTPVKGRSLVKRHEACAVMVNGEVVLIGGRGINKPTSIFNPKTQTWRKGKGPGPGVEIHHFQCLEADGKLWAVSSWTGKFPFEKNNNKIYVYDVKKDQWSTRKGMPSGRNRGSGAAVRRGDIIYVVAGNRGGHGAHATSLTWMDAYNFKTDTWLTKKYPNMPGDARDHVGGALVNDELCVAGGRDGGTKQFFNAVKTSTYCFNFKQFKWSKRGDFPQGRAGAMTATTCDGKMMIAGGEGFGQAFDRVDVFNGQKWTKAPSLKEARHGSGLAIAQCNKCGHIFIPSGSGRQGGSPELLTTEEWIPKGTPVKCASY